LSGPVGILGANGFIGSRTIEMMLLNGWAEPRAIVRRSEALATAKRFMIDGRIANAFDEEALRIAFRGCETVVHAIAGDPPTIVGTVDPVYRAAQAEGVHRIVYLSSASVHGQSPPFGTNEETPLTDDHPVEYNNAKVRAERRLLQLRRVGSVEMVLLRPGIVFGPRSYWTGGFADELAAGTAYLVEAGRGLCNSAYVDNVVHAIHLAMLKPAADGQAYIVGDAEIVTWADLCRPVAEALGYELGSISCPAPADFSEPWHTRLKLLSALRNIASYLPRPIYMGIKAAYAASNLRRVPNATPVHSGDRPFVVTQERALLHCCRTKLPFAKAERELGYSPIVSFDEGCRRSVGWLEFAGYPVRNRNDAGCSGGGGGGGDCPISDHIESQEIARRRSLSEMRE
jgi:nucleoside-diphosphate-sugar epimerase